MRTLFIFIHILLYFSFAWGQTIANPNLCAQQCEFCCRNQACQTQEYCSTGSTSDYAIIGGVAGGIVGLILLRVIYVKWIQPACCKPRRLKESDEPKSRGRASKEKKENDKKEKDKKKKEKKSASLSKKKSISDSKKKGAKEGASNISANKESLTRHMDENNSIVNPSRLDFENPQPEKVEILAGLEPNKENAEQTKSKQNLDVSPREPLVNSNNGNQIEKSSEMKKSSSNKTGEKKSGDKKPGDKSGQRNSSSNNQRSRSKDKPKSGTNMENSRKDKKGSSNMERSSKSKERSSSNNNPSKNSEGMAKSKNDNQV